MMELLVAFVPFPGGAAYVAMHGQGRGVTVPDWYIAVAVVVAMVNLAWVVWSAAEKRSDLMEVGLLATLGLFGAALWPMQFLVLALWVAGQALRTWQERL